MTRSGRPFRRRCVDDDAESTPRDEIAELRASRRERGPCSAYPVIPEPQVLDGRIPLPRSWPCARCQRQPDATDQCWHGLLSGWHVWPLLSNHTRCSLRECSCFRTPLRDWGHGTDSDLGQSYDCLRMAGPAIARGMTGKLAGGQTVANGYWPWTFLNRSIHRPVVSGPSNNYVMTYARKAK